ncbi:hypothetical protein ABKN59_006281 [Abortiporus biennis]
MSTYYVPPPQRTAPLEHQQYADSRRLVHRDGRLSPVDLNASIFVFPNPSSLPPSPGGSSLFSVSNGYSGEGPTSTSRSRGRDDSSSRYSTQSRTRGDRHNHSTLRRITRARSGSHHTPSSDNETWDWTSGSPGGEDSEEWELEAEVERVSRWDTVIQGPRRAWPIQTGPPEWISQTEVVLPLRLHPTYDGRYQEYSRPRTQSNLSLGSFSSLTSRLSTKDHPQPRARIPLLSFIASLFSLDLDDPALRLLENSTTSDSVLFPGQLELLGYEGDATESTSPSGAPEEEDASKRPHGLLGAFMLGDESRLSLRALKDGLAVVCNPTLGMAPSISLPAFSSFLGIYHLAGDTFSKGSKAFSELKSNQPS